MTEARTTAVATVDELAELFGLTTRRVQKLASDGVIPRAARGAYPRDACVRGYIRFLQDRVSGRDAGDVGRDIRAEQLRRVRLENDAREGLTLPTDDVKAMLLEVGLAFAAALDAAPGRMAPLVAHKSTPQCLEILTSENRRIRDETAKKLESLSAAAGPGGSDPGAGG